MKSGSTCGSCGAPLYWTITDKNQKRLPLNPDPVPDGNVIVVGTQHDNRFGQVPVCHVLRNDEVPLADQPRFVSHWTTCRNPPVVGS